MYGSNPKSELFVQTLEFSATPPKATFFTVCVCRVYGSGGAGGLTNKPPKLELDGKKWVVEYFKVG